MRKRLGYLNATGLAVAGVLFGFAVYATTPQSLLQHAQETLAAVGVTIAVAPNPYNTVAAQLSAKEAQLNQKEAQLNAQAATQTRPSLDNRYGFYSLCSSLVLLVLVAMNFYLDNRRRSGGPQRTYSVDLR